MRCDIFRAGYDLAGGRKLWLKDHPWTKEQRDYNLKYLISAALLDGQVGPTQLDAARIQAPDAQAMVAPRSVIFLVHVPSISLARRSFSIVY